MNLLNRLRSAGDSAGSKAQSPCMPPKSSQIIPDIDEKIDIGNVRNKAAGIMSAALNELKARIPEVQKPEKLAQIAAEMNKVLITRDDKDEKKTSHIVIYAPQILREEHFETLVVSE